MNNKRWLSIAIVTMLILLTACGGNKKDGDANTETTTIESTDEQTCDTTVEETLTEKTTTEETTTLEETETSIDVVPEDDATTVNEVSSSVEKETTTKKKQQTTKKPKKTTSKKEEQTTEFVENGMNIWKYRSNIYANDPVKRDLETIFWNEFGWTAFSAKKNDVMVKAMVELVYDIMQNNKTDFERERALYEAICLSCSYDHESLDTGLTNEGQTPYGVLIEHKAVCGGYAGTFHIGLCMMGIENRLITGMTTEGLHAWNQVCLDGEWYQVDVTWGDKDSDDAAYAFSYKYFNRTSEWMSTTHDVRGEDCQGTKYNEEYLRQKYTNDFLVGKKYFETVEECMNYINSQLEKGNETVLFYAPTKIWAEVLDIVEDYENWKKLYPLSENVTRNYYQYGYSAERSQQYKYIEMEHIGEIKIEIYSVDKFRKGGNFFENFDDMIRYMDEQLRSGSQEVIVYYNFPRDFNIELEILNHGGYIMHFTTVDTEYRSFDSINMIRITPDVEE